MDIVDTSLMMLLSGEGGGSEPDIAELDVEGNGIYNASDYKNVDGVAVLITDPLTEKPVDGFSPVLVDVKTNQWTFDNAKDAQDLVSIVQGDVPPVGEDPKLKTEGVGKYSCSWSTQSVEGTWGVSWCKVTYGTPEKGYGAYTIAPDYPPSDVKVDRIEFDAERGTIAVWYYSKTSMGDWRKDPIVTFINASEYCTYDEKQTGTGYKVSEIWR